MYTFYSRTHSTASPMFPLGVAACCRSIRKLTHDVCCPSMRFRSQCAALPVALIVCPALLTAARRPFSKSHIDANAVHQYTIHHRRSIHSSCFHSTVNIIAHTAPYLEANQKRNITKRQGRATEPALTGVKVVVERNIVNKSLFTFFAFLC